MFDIYTLFVKNYKVKDFHYYLFFEMYFALHFPLIHDMSSSLPGSGLG